MAVRRVLRASLAVATMGVAAHAAPAPAPAAPPDPAAEIAKLEASVPPPRAADVGSIDAIMHAIYDVISGPPGPRDWNRFRSLLVPVARLTTSTIDAHGRPRVVLIGVEDYISKAGAHFATQGFFESGLVNRWTGSATWRRCSAATRLAARRMARRSRAGLTACSCFMMAKGGGC